MHYVYILHSESINKFYIGYSQNPTKRLEFHNSRINNIWSKRGQPWDLVIIFPFSSKTDALRAEIFIKKQKSTLYIREIIEHKSITRFK